jgi:hypothetical protein
MYDYKNKKHMKTALFRDDVKDILSALFSAFFGVIIQPHLSREKLHKDATMLIVTVKCEWSLSTRCSSVA